MTTVSSARKEGAFMPPRAYSYIRFSSYRQERGDSVRRQSAFAVEICQENGWFSTIA
jgi:hypothetical protein